MLHRFSLQMREKRFAQAGKMKNVAHTLPLMEPPLPTPKLSLLHECIQSHGRMTRTSHSPTKWNVYSNACHSGHSTLQRGCGALFTLNPSFQCQVVSLQESDLQLIPVSFCVTVCLLPLLRCSQCTSWFSHCYSRTAVPCCIICSASHRGPFVLSVTLLTWPPSQCSTC